MQTDILIIGAGAAGLLCARESALRGFRVCVLDHADEPGKKIRISGGGRCNFTNLHATHEHFRSANPDFARSALARYTPQDFLDLVESHHIAWHEKSAGQLFCDGSARQIVDMLTADAASAGARIELGCAISSWRQVENGFTLATSLGDISATRLVVATGGLSLPAIGASPLGYRVAESFGLGIIPPRAALVPYTWNERDRVRYGPLAGVSCDVRVQAGGASHRDAMLFTHRGLSGPAILQSSLTWSQGDTITIDLLPGLDAHALIRAQRGHARDASTLLGAQLPRRVAEAWCAEHAPSTPPQHWTALDIDRFASALHAWTVHPSGTLGYRTAEVTAGGVDTAELSSKTMEVRRVPGLYFIGEVVDVTGLLGGYNFQWAWSSAMAAARSF